MAADYQIIAALGMALSDAARAVPAFTAPPSAVADQQPESLIAARGKSGCEQSQQGGPLFDHSVGAGEQLWQHFEAERPHREQVDNQIELGRLLGFSRSVSGLH